MCFARFWGKLSASYSLWAAARQARQKPKTGIGSLSRTDKTRVGFLSHRLKVLIEQDREPTPVSNPVPPYQGLGDVGELVFCHLW